MKAHIKIHYKYRGVTALQEGSFYVKKRSIPYMAYEWIEQLQKNMPEMEILKVLHDDKDITNEVKEMERPL